jgi:hypothetical protein
MIKKVLVSLCVLPLLLTACSKDEVIAPVADSGKAIEFGTVLAPSSRGAVVDKDALQLAANGFTVSAYNQGTATTWAAYLSGLSNVLPATPNFMNNTPVTWDDANSERDYSPVKYWPGIVSGGDYGHVTFFGLGGGTFTYNATSHAPEFVHTTPALAANQKDLVADVLFDEKWSAGKQVKFQFKHILSKIGFTAKLAADYTSNNVEIKVTNLKVVYLDNKVKSKGTYAFNTNATTANDGWTPTGTDYLTGESGELVASAGKVVTSTGTADPDLLNEAGKFLMLIPQSIDAASLKVVFTYTVTQGGVSEGPYDKEYAIPAIQYKQGKQYAYNFTFTLHEVVFDEDIDVSNWDGTDPQPGDITIQ